jgi:hypothetical protein
MKIFEKRKAIKLRERGYSFAQISAELHISKSTASLWTRSVIMGPKGKSALEKRVKESRERSARLLHSQKIDRLQKADDEADKLLEKIVCSSQITVAALAMMFWCEGAKNNNRVVFVNSDSELVKAFIVMLSEVFIISREKIRVCIHLHDYHDKDETLQFWSSVLNIPISQFTKSFKKESNHINIREGYKGCARITYHNAHIARVLLSFAKKFIKLYSNKRTGDSYNGSTNVSNTFSEGSIPSSPAGKILYKKDQR